LFADLFAKMNAADLFAKMHSYQLEEMHSMQATAEASAGPTYVTEEDAKTATGQRRGITKTCDAAINDADPFGDGDQSLLAQAPGSKGQELKNVWCHGGNYNPGNPDLGHFTRSCYLGRVKVVRELLQLARESVKPEQRQAHVFKVFGPHVPPGLATTTEASGDSSGIEWLFALTNFRESVLRVSPLHAAVMGARTLTMPAWAAFRDLLQGETPDHVEVSRLLIDAGSSVTCKDIAGATCVHHATTNYANEHTLAILPLLVAAGANVNSQDRFGNVAMSEPCMGRKLCTVRALLELGCDSSFVGPGGFSPRTLCVTWPEGQKLLSEASRGKISIGTLPLRGQIVRIKGLIKGADFNGTVGFCGALDASTGRHAVAIKGRQRPLGLKPANLDLISKLRCVNCGASHAQAQAAATFATSGRGGKKKKGKKKKAAERETVTSSLQPLLKCSHCYTAACQKGDRHSLAYRVCSRACQEADRPLHKVHCKFVSSADEEGSVTESERSSQSATTSSGTPTPPSLSSVFILWPLNDRSKGLKGTKGFTGKEGGTIGSLGTKSRFLLKVSRSTIDDALNAAQSSAMSPLYQAEFAKMEERAPGLLPSFSSKKMEKTPMYCYDKERTTVFGIYPDEEAFAPLDAHVKEFGVEGIKAYFEVLRLEGEEDGAVRLDTAQMRLPQRW
jgi:hypothetical protein